MASDFCSLRAEAFVKIARLECWQQDKGAITEADYGSIEEGVAIS